MATGRPVEDVAAVLGVAGNIVQFLDFGTHLSRNICEIWNSHTEFRISNSKQSPSTAHAGVCRPTGVEELGVEAAELPQAFCKSLDSISDDLAKYHGYFQQNPVSAGQNVNYLHKIQQIIYECRIQVADLMDRIARLRGNSRPGNWSNFVMAVNSTWTIEELDTLCEWFATWRRVLEDTVLFSLKTMNSPESQQRGLFDFFLEARRKDQFDKPQSSMSALISDTIRLQMITLPRWTATHSLRLEAAARVGDADIEGEHLSAKQLDTSFYSRFEAGKKSSELPLARSYATKLARVEGQVMNSLYFPVLTDREEAIADAETTTLNWIFYEPRSTDRPWDNFGKWLESGETLYWISGKAGSGKSTLMKHLASHGKTRKALATWAGNTPLIIATYFFWYPGSKLQNSLEGLLRALLYSCLKGRRELIPLVVPDLLADSADILKSFWTMPRLLKAFERLMSQTKLDHRFCFLIDGLDEFAGAPSEVAAFVKEMAAHANAKVCASSRPLAVFDPAFSGLPRLVLQNLTFDDISHYVGKRLTDNALMSQLENDEPGLSAELTANIVTKASGVFLWVRLVVESLLEGLSNFDVGLDLRRRIDDLPPDLEDLYWHMIDRVKPQWYLEEGFRLIRMVKAAGGRLRLPELCLAELSLSKLSWNELEDIVLSKGVNKLCFQMGGRLKSRCLGLLEVSQDEDTECLQDLFVTFIHKSVYDFLETPAATSRILKVPGQEQFIPAVAFMKGKLLSLKVLGKKRGVDSRNLTRAAFVGQARQLLCEFLEWAKVVEENYQQEDINWMIDELERVGDELWASVDVRPTTEQPRYHWMGAPWTTRPWRRRDSHHDYFVPHFLAKEPIWWDIKHATYYWLEIHAFEDVIRLAGLERYANTRYNNPSTAAKPLSIRRRQQEYVLEELGQSTDTSSETGTCLDPGHSSAASTIHTSPHPDSHLWLSPVQTPF